VVADGVDVSDDSQEAFVHHSDGPPPVLCSADNGGSNSEPTYAQPVLLRSLNNTVHPPATTEKTLYDNIQRFQNQQVTCSHILEVSMCI
jgi:hypothetical protein